MKKGTHNHGDIEKFDDPFKQRIHGLWRGASEQVDKDNLRRFIDDEGKAKIHAMENDDDITVEEVLLIGAYSMLEFIHGILHGEQAEQMINVVMDGSKSLGEALHEMGVDLPEDMVAEMDTVIKTIAKQRKKR